MGYGFFADGLLIRAVRSVERSKVQMAVIAAQHDVRARDRIENHFLNAIFRISDKSEDPSSRSGALLGLLHQPALTERTCDRDRLEALLQWMVLRRFISHIPSWV